MPVYDFTCQNCGKQFDKFFRGMAEKPKADCPHCGSAQTKRGLSLVNAGESKGGSAGGGEMPQMPMCGRCGGPRPCGMD